MFLARIPLLLILGFSCAGSESTSSPGSEPTRVEAPPVKAWPVIEPTIKDLAYAQKSPAEKLDL
jgi:hypothetical protein